MQWYEIVGVVGGVQYGGCYVDKFFGIVVLCYVMGGVVFSMVDLCGDWFGGQ